MTKSSTRPRKELFHWCKSFSSFVWLADTILQVYGSRAFSGHPLSAARYFAQEPSWWAEHYNDAANSILEFFAGDGIELSGQRVLDLGCGDGITSLGLAMRGVDVVGVDLQPVDEAGLLAQANDRGIRVFPDHLRFDLCEIDAIPSIDEWFDAVVAWSVFEHVQDQDSLLQEIRRVLRPRGLLFVQIYPMWNSRNGSHLWPFHQRDFDHLIRSPQDLELTVGEVVRDPDLAASFVDLFRSCNRCTIDSLQRSLLNAGFYIAKVSLKADTFHVPIELQNFSLTEMGVSEIQLLAVRQ